jgi:hypothetical protein
MTIYMLGSATYWFTGNPPGSPTTFCGIGYDLAYDHAWPMCSTFGDSRDYNQGCWSRMHYLAGGQYQTIVLAPGTGIQINYVRTVDAGPCLQGAQCSPDLCYDPQFSPPLVIDLTPGAFQALGYSLGIGHFPVWVGQP